MDRLRYLAEQFPSANDTGLLVLRVAVAVIFVVHGYGDISQPGGVTSNVGNYQGAGIPLAALTAPFAAIVQFFGGILLVAGLLSRAICAGLAVVMVGALVFVHAGESIPIGPDGSGSGFALIMGAASFALLLAGPGRFSADYAIAQRFAGSLRPVTTATIRKHAA
ncbi:DoxX family protein [Actinocorallia sp. API 0066]|uniref:DoxX family protein n=1 Tax=Actinocorallia sp. API 0066 TaxID=2896846 RepID=UPI001E36C78C|nr:DoxX family protein [Actinocorallia sp. API 0066]MCD0447758.1 DoxX family protein [Actinocorallia sp. API 0066]